MTADLERAICGALLTRPRRVLDVDLDPRWFTNERCRRVYLAVVELTLRDGHDQLDVSLVQRHLADQGEQVGLAELFGLIEGEGFNLRGMARELRRGFQRRMAQALTESMLMALRDDTADVRDVVFDRTEHLLALFAKGDHEVVGYLEAVGARIDAALAKDAGTERVPTGFEALDDVLGGGLPRGGLTIVGARPGRGKSSFLQQVCEHGMMRGVNVLLCTPEMSRAEVGDRAASRFTRVPLRPLTSRYLTEMQRHQLRHPPITPAWGTGSIYDDPQQTTQRIAQVARRLAAGVPLEVIAVDYIQFLADKRESKSEPRYEVIGRSARRLKAVARQAGAVMAVGAQLRRDAETRDPNLADLRESGDLEQDADVVLLLCDPDESGFVRVLVEKHRQGPTGECTLRWQREFTEFARGAA